MGRTGEIKIERAGQANGIPAVQGLTNFRDGSTLLLAGSHGFFFPFLFPVREEAIRVGGFQLSPVSDRRKNAEK
jgi:hypothetical protein